MKRSLLVISACFAVTLSLSSCSPKLTGTWTIGKYENAAPDEQGYSLSNIGTITFLKNGTGQKNIQYTILGTTHTDMFPFKWTQADAAVNITGDSTTFSKSWIIVTNKRNFQQWKSTNGNRVQVLELKKN